jgi:chemotaxis signal transduction protein
VGLPRLLLVDDSEAILAYERAALRDRYDLSSAVDGLDALQQLQAAGGDLPALVVLDLSMPRMDGEELLGRLRADPRLRELPVLLVSSEQKRAHDLVDGERVVGALHKPIEAVALRATVERVLDETQRRRALAGLVVLRLDVGPHEFAVPLSAVREVLAQPLCRRIAGGPDFLSELLNLRGAPIAVLDLARRLAVAPRARYVDRSLVVVDAGGRALALAVDAVTDPELVAREDVIDAKDVAGSAHGALKDLLVGVVKAGAARALVPVLRPEAFVDPALLEQLAQALAADGDGAVADGAAP